MTKQARCAPTAHDFFKFDDASIVCHRCGEQRVVDLAALVKSLPQPVYLPCPLPHYPPTWPYTPTFVWDSGTGDQLPWPGTSITYTSSAQEALA